MPSYFDKKHTGGAEASKGLNFQDQYAAVTALDYLGRVGFQGVTSECQTDLEFLCTQERLHIQAKSGRITIGELKEVLGEFRQRLNDDPGIPLKFVLLCSEGMDKQVQSLLRVLEEFRESRSIPYTEREKRRIESDFERVVKRFWLPLTPELADSLWIKSFRVTDPQEQKLVFRGKLLGAVGDLALGISSRSCDTIFESFLTRFSEARQKRSMVTFETLVTLVAQAIPGAKSDLIVEAFRRSTNRRSTQRKPSRHEWSGARAIIRGTVRLAGTDSRISQVHVALSGQVLQHSAHYLTTGTGTFEFLNVVPDRYDVNLQLEFPSRCWEETGRGAIDVHLFGHQQGLEVSVGETHVLDMTIPNLGAIYGFVRDAHTNRPVRGARVRVGSRMTWTDPEGVYQLTRIEVGNNEVEVLATAYAESRYRADIQSLVVTKEEQRLDLTLQPLSAHPMVLIGKVTEGIDPPSDQGYHGDGAANAVVEIIDETGAKVFGTEILPPGAPAPGNYAFYGITPGTYVVKAWKAGFYSASGRITVDKGVVHWAPDLHLRPIAVTEPPVVDAVWLENPVVRGGENLQVRVRMDRPVKGVGIGYRDKAVGQSIPLELLDEAKHVWGLELQTKLVPGEYSIVDVQVTDVDRRFWIFDTYARFEVV